MLARWAIETSPDFQVLAAGTFCPPSARGRPTDRLIERATMLPYTVGRESQPKEKNVTTTTATTCKRWTAAELRRLPAHEREVVLQAVAELAEAEYRTNPELTAFEAFGKDDLHADRASTETR